jgi:protein MpaA
MEACYNNDCAISTHHVAVARGRMRVTGRARPPVRSGISRRRFLDRAARALLGSALFAAIGAGAGQRVVAASRATHPAFPAARLRPPVRRTVIGRTVEGRELEVWRIGRGPTNLFVMGGVHTGQEARSADLAADLALYYRRNPDRVPASITLHIVTNANPDGYTAGRRNNANDVNLNRNWAAQSWRPDACYAGGLVLGGSAPLSEPETTAIDAYLKRIGPTLSISYHARGSIVEDNDVAGADEYAAFYARSAGYEHVAQYRDVKCIASYGTRYDLTGQWLSAMREAHLPAFDVELSDFHLEDFEQNLAALNATLGLLDAKVRYLSALAPY